jgi:hypothetical protein
VGRAGKRGEDLGLKMVPGKPRTRLRRVDAQDLAKFRTDVRGVENEREKISWPRPTRSSSSGMHGVPRSSSTVRISTTEKQLRDPGADVAVQFIVP